jgi:glycosyltransferase 2 family protein
VSGVRRWGSPAFAVVALAVVIWIVGSGPFLAGLEAVDGRALLAAAGVVLVTTLLSAWRWRLVACGLGVEVSFAAAVAAYYRSLFLNLVLPGGVAGDVHRGVRHGRDVRDVGRALRAVWWERAAGQLVQVVLTIVVLLALPSPVRSSMPLVAVAAVAVAFGVVLVGRVFRGDAQSRRTRLANAIVGDLRNGVLRRNAFPAILLASVLVVLGHAVTFLIAARTVGVDAPSSRLLPLALLALLGMVLPNVGGWGPREGVTAWVFAAAGLGADRGAAAAVAYGVLVFAASLPGAVVLVAGWLAGRRRSRLVARRPVVLRPKRIANG